MMNPVMGGGNEKVFQETQFIDFLRVYQNAPYLRSGIYKSNINGLETQKSDWYEINKPIQRFQHRGTETYRKIEHRRGVMRNMGGPEEPAGMIHPVQPVIHKIFEDQ